MSDLFDQELQRAEADCLADEIRRHDQLYWKKGNPEISDDAYDALVRRLAAIAPGHPLLDRVHGPVVSGNGKVRHTKPMLSLDKAYSLEEVLAWAGKFARSPAEPLLVQPKYDGISANYDGAVLATRGDGEFGEDISDKLPLLELETDGYRGPVNRPVRGEIVIRDDDFRSLYRSIVKRDGKPYKNSRNAVAGIMGLKEIGEMVRQGAKLTLVDYSLVTYTVLFSELRDRWPTILAEIERLPYPMDGLVVQFSDVGFRESLGSTAHHPRGQIAFKFSGIRRHTRLLAVEWSFGKNCLTPVAELEPVEIGGITIRHATLHNRQNIEEKDIRIGDTVVVERAGDVIPYIVSAIPGEERRSALIENCPCCGTRLANDGPELRCLNPDCLETSVQRLTAAIRNIGIERLGEPNVRKMMKNLGVRKLWDIFKLSREQILSLEGFKEKSADNLLREIEAARRVPDFQVLAALNITGIGKTVAKDLLSRFPLETLRTMTENDLCNLRGIGPERAAALAAELRKQSDILDELLGCVNLIRTSLENDGIKRPTICFTGKMPEKREFYATLARERGFDPIESVSSSLALLVAMNPEENGGKLKAARKLGIAVVSLEEWLKNEGAAVPDVSNKPDASKPKIEAEKWDDTPRIQPDLFA